jgi:hypothetical protein
VIEYRLFVHLFGEGTNLIVGELADIIAKHYFVFGKSGEGCGIRKLQSFRHKDTSDLETRLAASGRMANRKL